MFPKLVRFNDHCYSHENRFAFLVLFFHCYRTFGVYVCVIVLLVLQLHCNSMSQALQVVCTTSEPEESIKKPDAMLSYPTVNIVLELSFRKHVCMRVCMMPLKLWGV
ncbi:hypothetical protein XENOCAPTIV_018447 [Xenoophorus captivus]|uniref:Uncharacterized protein n=1 Tax=Xenoophorus captivus TaxID=1517983 RepID=A0ABV0R225_9TELE